ncbi:hypothetical protein V4W48_21915 [Pseudomonas aeruginosa]|uniref:hypothetical protein n=1 Tax=Pseudomonas aeruginosa TaxID=287 RepID=UPI00123EFCDA|nr:hypothetical protein [Pseudomonas aeruginosa]MDI3667754.1 hypothetical protein [Pseudomonas aeruginosa]MDV7918892.1 hypothetical protein [Pseudomonas aeruginosa]HBN8287769.1 hypothetical protein [Pseudomonas aeruginosa]HBN8289010.1 hypothetical protein [Pseudomonas aeruginosa]
MLPRFVIVPAVPIETEAFRNGSRFYATTTSGGFDIYDNQEKMRLTPSYSTKVQADSACAKMNAECRNPNELFPPLRIC